MRRRTLACCENVSRLADSDKRAQWLKRIVLAEPKSTSSTDISPVACFAIGTSSTMRSPSEGPLRGELLNGSPTAKVRKRRNLVVRAALGEGQQFPKAAGQRCDPRTRQSISHNPFSITASQKPFVTACKSRTFQLHLYINRLQRRKIYVRKCPPPATGNGRVTRPAIVKRSVSLGEDRSSRRISASSTIFVSRSCGAAEVTSGEASPVAWRRVSPPFNLQMQVNWPHRKTNRAAATARLPGEATDFSARNQGRAQRTSQPEPSTRETRAPFAETSVPLPPASNTPAALSSSASSSCRSCSDALRTRWPASGRPSPPPAPPWL